MNPNRFDRLSRTLGTATDRRTLLQGTAAFTAAVVGGAVLADVAEAKALCRKNGSRCKKKSKRCQAKYCVKTPFTIEARWSNPTSDHDTILFVPNKEGSNLSSPFIAQSCSGASSNCVNEYPFACVSQDAQGPGDEITTVLRLLGGTYEYWIRLAKGAPGGDVEVTLRNAGGRVIRSWSSPENPESQKRFGWHVFDLARNDRSISSVDERIDHEWPWAGHSPGFNICPWIP